ncbi:PREDICTED: myb-like DNA-binding protein myb-1 isoform X1 [Populus euphratica]|uniref:Myb-like DNA-binding protein myb-1 isoform X1 n=1 Tax=Populus euphratica TaxID=75702 RepID=A0AAJ6UUW3_POPEU|nr:PREDICTED: myb-like DNA-binding protein myb-1 isoform X1 [Populus euphratica]
MEMTLQHFYNITCCHQENDGIPSHYTTSTTTPCNSSAMETLNDMGSLSVDPNSRMPLNICSSVCFDMGQRGFALEGKCCSNRLENNPCSEEVGDDGKEQKHKAALIENIEESLVNGKEIMEGREPNICNRGHWRPAEDSKLKELVALYGPQNWNLMAEKLRGRSGKSCRLRWFNQLDPKIKRAAFNEDEEERLMAAHRIYGNKWALIARFFPGRTDNAVKNHWHVVMARKYREQSCIYRRRKRTQAVQRRVDNAGDSVSRNTVRNTDPNSNIICNSRIIKPSCIPFSPLIGGSNCTYAKMTAGLLFSRSHHGSLAEETPRFFSAGHQMHYNMLRDSDTCTVFHAMQQPSNRHFPGFSDAVASSATQATVSEPSSSSLSVAENTEASSFEITTTSPPFIDFLGVGATGSARVSKTCNMYSRSNSVAYDSTGIIEGKEK